MLDGPQPPDQISIAWLDGDYTTCRLLCFVNRRNSDVAPAGFHRSGAFHLEA
jgi:hypothetical protein